MLAEILSYVGDVRRRLLEQYRNSVTIAGLLEVAAAQAQELESQLWLMTLQTSIGYYGPTPPTPADIFVTQTPATGIWLDWLGARVGEPRNGLGDGEYATQIHARILCNKSSGTIPELAEVVSFSLFGAPYANFSIEESYPAALVIDLGEEIDLEGEARLAQAKVRIARAAGVGAMILFNEENDALTFTFSSSTALEPSAFEGFGDSSNPATGGSFAGALLA